MRYKLSRYCVLVFLFTSGLVHLSGASAEDKNGLSPSRLKLPKGPGSLEGIGENIELNLNMGLMSYGVPIKLPQGYEKLSPKLRLSYQSGGGNSTIGLGWSLSVPSIERMTSKGLPQYTAADHMSAGEELVKVSEDGSRAVYRARIEGQFIRYTWYNPGAQGYWTAEHPDGTISYYGADQSGELKPEARVFGPDGVFRYHLVSKVDLFGHVVRYSYRKVRAYSLLDRIEYVFNGRERGRYRVELIYEDRPDQISDAKPGFDLRLDRRLRTVAIFARDQQRSAYRLRYSDDHGLSLLSAVETYGRNNDVPLPSIQSFEYTSGDLTPVLVTMDGSTGGGWSSGDVDLIDINGDGLPDVLDTTDGVHRFYLNEIDSSFFDPLTRQGQGQHRFSQAQLSALNDEQSGARLSNPNVQTLDLNGDGLTDIVNGAADPIEVLWNRGEGDWAEITQEDHFGLPDFQQLGSNLRFYDWDNDKRIDLIFSDRSVSEVRPKLADGGFGDPILADDLELSFSQDGVRLADMNGDGLQDAVRRLGFVVVYRLNLGYGRWSQDIIMESSPQLSEGAKVFFTDINGDALSDLLYVVADEVGFTLNRNGRSFGELTLVEGIELPEYTALSYQLRLADMNANGSTDLVYIDQAGLVTYLDMFTERRNLLNRVENGLGKVMEVSYGSATRDMVIAEEGDAPWAETLPYPQQTITELRIWEARFPNTQEIKTFRYRDPHHSALERNFHGFSQVELRRDGGEASETLRSVHRFDRGKTEFARKGKELFSATFSDERLIKEITTTYNLCPVTGAEFTVVRWACKSAQEVDLIEQSATQTLAEARAAALTTRETWQYDGYGNVTLEANEGVVAGTCTPCGARGLDSFGEPCSDGARTCRGDERYVAKEYARPSNSLWLNGLVCRERTFGRSLNGEPADDVYSEKRSYYDGTGAESLPLCTVDRGLTRKTEVRRESADYITQSELTYDETHGVVIAERNAIGGERSFVYGEDYLLLTEERASFSDRTLISQSRYDEVLDLAIESAPLLREDDIEGTERLWTRYEYDQFGRLIALYHPDQPNNEPSALYEYHLGSPISKIITRQKSKPRGSYDRESVKCFDGMGRHFNTLSRVRAGVYLAQNAKRFDVNGKEWLKYHSAELSSPQCEALLPVMSEQRLDATDRLQSTITYKRADGAETRRDEKRYTPLTVTEYDEHDLDPTHPHADTPTVVSSNGLGLKYRSSDLAPSDAAPYELSYHFDALGYPTDIIVNGHIKKTQHHDRLGRVTSVDDVNIGHIEYSYDDLGGLIYRLASDGVERHYSYDEHGRLTTRWDGASEFSRVTYLYDETDDCVRANCAFNATKLTSVSFKSPHNGESFVKHMEYNFLGNPIYLSYLARGHLYEFELDYDLLSSPTRKRFPNGVQLFYTNDSMGRLTGVKPYLELEWDARGQLGSYTLQGKDTVSYQYGYDLRLNETNYELSSGRSLRHIYHYDEIGNIIAVDDQSPYVADHPTWNATYDYDHLDQLTGALLDAQETTFTEQLSYTFDTERHLTSRSSSLSGLHRLTFDVDSDKILGFESPAQSFEPVYNARGSITEAIDRYTWDAFERLIELSDSSEWSERYVYDESEIRVFKQTQQGSNTLYLQPDFQIKDGVAKVQVMISRMPLLELASPWSPEGDPLDLAPLKATDAVYSEMLDGKVTAGDAWIRYAVAEGILDLERDLDKRSVDEALMTASNVLVHDDEHRSLFYNHLGTLIASDVNGILDLFFTYPFGEQRYATPKGQTKYYALHERDESGLVYGKMRYLSPMLFGWLSSDPLFETVSAKNTKFTEEKRDNPKVDVLDRNSIQTNNHKKSRYAYEAFIYSSSNPLNLIDPDGLDANHHTVESLRHKRQQSNSHRAFNDGVSHLFSIRTDQKSFRKNLTKTVEDKLVGTLEVSIGFVGVFWNLGAQVYHDGMKAYHETKENIETDLNKSNSILNKLNPFSTIDKFESD